MSNMEKVNEMLKKDPELMEKVNAEVKRLADAKEAATPEEAMSRAIKTVLCIDLAEEDLTESRKMNLDELDNVAGGITISFTCSFLGHDWELTTAKQTGSFRNGPDSQYEEYTFRRCGQKYYNKIKIKENYTVMDDVKNRLGLNVIDEDTYRDVKQFKDPCFTVRLFPVPASPKGPVPSPRYVHC